MKRKTIKNNKERNCTGFAFFSAGKGCPGEQGRLRVVGAQDGPTSPQSWRK